MCFPTSPCDRPAAAGWRRGTRSGPGEIDIDPHRHASGHDTRSRIGCWRWQVGTQHVESTDAVHAILGLAGRSSAPTFDALIAQVHGEDRERVVAAFERCAGEGEGGALTFRIRRSDGEIRSCCAEMSPQTDRVGKVVAILGLLEDVTTRTPGYKSPRKSEHLFRTVIDAVPALIGVKDRDSRYVLVNARFAGYHRRPVAWFEGRTIADFYEEPYAEQQIEDDKTVIASKQASGFSETTHAEPDGRVTDWLANRVPVHDATGAVEYIVDIGLEITDLKRARAAQQQSRELLHAVVDAVPVSLNLKDLEGKYVLVNAHEAKLYGRPPEWFLGRRAADFVPAAYARQLSERDRKVIESGEGLGWHDDHFSDANGNVGTWLATKLPLFDTAGDVQYVLSIGLDVTDRRRAEEALRASQRLLRAVVDAVPAMVCVKDAERRCVFANKVFADYFGQSPEWFGGRSIDELLPADYVAVERRRDQRVFDTGRATGFFEEMFTEPDGRKTVWLGNVAPLADDMGRVGHIVSVGLDITERRQAQASLQESQALLRTIIDTVPATITVKDPRGNYVLVNAYQANSFGRSTDWFVGKNTADLWPADYLPRLLERDQKVIATRQTHRFYEDDYVGPDGRHSAWMGIRSPILDAAGDVSYLVSVGLDITDLRRAERAVQEGRALLQTVIDTVPAVVSVTDSDGRYIFVNETSARYHGHPADWFPGKSLEEVHSADYARLLRERDRRVLQGEAVAGVYEEQFVEPDGRVMSWLSTDVPLLDGAGKAKYVVSVSLDISDRRRSETALKESEQRFRHLVESVGVVPYTWDVDHRRYLYVGPQAQGMFGYPIDQWIDDQSWFARVHPDDRDVVKRHAMDFSADPKDDEFEYRMVAADGRTVWIRDVQKVQKSEDGRRISYGMMFDVTASKLRDQQLAQAQKMEAIGKLTGGIAHDFNNLLTVVLGNLDLLEHVVAGDRQQAERIRLAKTATKRGADLTRRLLAFARRQVLEPQLVDINSALSQLGELMRRTLGEAIAVRMKLADGLWPVRVDPAWFESAVLNLAINSRDAMPQGGTLTIETANRWLDQNYAARHAEAVPGPYAMLIVGDTGAGMSPDVLAQAFDPFFTTKEFGKGTGLGLSMVYGFVKQSGGHIRIDSEQGRGTTVRIHLRKAEPAVAESDHEGSEADEEPTGTETILVVEDDASVRDTAVAMLRSLGYTVLVAADGTRALRHLDADPAIAVLVADVVLTGALNGPALAREAMRRIPGIGVLFVSGYADDAITYGGVLEGATERLGKPYSKLDLARKVRRLLDKLTR